MDSNHPKRETPATQLTFLQSQEQQRVRLSELDVSEHNVRRHESSEDLEELSASLEHFGLLQPIVIQPKRDRYEILIGQRRYLAAKRLGWESIPARILSNSLSEVDARAISFAENAQRRDLTPRDKADACTFLLERLETVKAVADYLGTSDTTVRRWLGYSAVPEPIKALVESNRISRPTASRISESFSDEDKAIELARRVAEMTPVSADRERILEAAETYPDQSVDFILSRAEQMREVREIAFILPDRWTPVLDEASRTLIREAEDIAQEATIEWLQRFQNSSNQA